MDKRAGLLVSTVALLVAIAACGGSVNSVPVPRPTPSASPSPGPTGTPTASPGPTASPTLAPFGVAPSSLTFNAGTSSTQNLTVTDPIIGPYSAAGCSGVVSTSVSAATISVTALGGGICTLTISDVDGRSVGVPISVTAVSVPVQ